MLRHAQHVAGEMLEVQRALVVVGIAVAARVPGGGPEMLGKHRQLQIPVAAIAAYSVQEQHQRARSLDRNRDARRRLDEDGFHAYSALAPEILTACARLALSLFR